ncbi:MAG: N-acetyl-gamma-glutamyl-phosphate reductase [Paenibacillus sp. RIFOXYA1_FULL_44_5]|nr:MAG: N-acetyl-gamma-glutamyl-phosphate reductase [Paenibacillus sp. RIFOXYA1_FULL_44_5]
MERKLRVAIVGSTGYGGVELIRLLSNHPYVQITSVISSSNAGTPITDGYPHLQNIVTEYLDPVDPELIKGKADVAFTATPHGVSAELSPRFLEAGIKVIDLSGDFRLPAELYEKWYKRKAAEPEFLQKAFYGLADVYGSEAQGADFISNPGCYPTAASLGLIPALHADVIDRSSIIIDAKSGVSGAGRGLAQNVHFAEMNENFLAYKVNKHQHTPEIEMILERAAGEPVTVTFTPHLLPITRGILCTSYASLKESYTEEELLDLYRNYYLDRPFVRIREKGKWPATKEVWGSNYCDIGLSVDERTGRLTIISVIDNLVKGAAGQAIQNLNLMMGWEETTGLQFVPVYP